MSVKKQASLDKIRPLEMSIKRIEPYFTSSIKSEFYDWIGL